MSVVFLRKITSSGRGSGAKDEFGSVTIGNGVLVFDAGYIVLIFGQNLTWQRLGI